MKRGCWTAGRWLCNRILLLHFRQEQGQRITCLWGADGSGGMGCLRNTGMGIRASMGRGSLRFGCLIGRVEGLSTWSTPYRPMMKLPPKRDLANTNKIEGGVR